MIPLISHTTASPTNMTYSVLLRDAYVVFHFLPSLLSQCPTHRGSRRDTPGLSSQECVQYYIGLTMLGVSLPPASFLPACCCCWAGRAALRAAHQGIVQ